MLVIGKVNMRLLKWVKGSINLQGTECTVRSIALIDASDTLEVLATECYKEVTTQ